MPFPVARRRAFRPRGVRKSTTSSMAPAPTPDPRVGLRAGRNDAAEAAWNLKVMSKTLPPERHVDATNSDLAFTGNYAIQGNYNGPLIWDISNPGKPTLMAAYLLPGVAERRVGLQEPALRVGRGEQRAARLRPQAACRTR